MMEWGIALGAVAGSDDFDGAVLVGIGHGGAGWEAEAEVEEVFGDVSAYGAAFVAWFAGIGLLAFD